MTSTSARPVKPANQAATPPSPSRCAQARARSSSAKAVHSSTTSPSEAFKSTCGASATAGATGVAGVDDGDAVWIVRSGGSAPGVVGAARCGALRCGDVPRSALKRTGIGQPARRVSGVTLIQALTFTRC